MRGAAWIGEALQCKARGLRPNNKQIKRGAARTGKVGCGQDTQGKARFFKSRLWAWPAVGCVRSCTSDNTVRTPALRGQSGIYKSLKARRCPAMLG